MTAPDTSRNVAAITSLFERYRDAWRTHRIETPPRGMLAWAPGATMEVGKYVTHIPEHRDWADEPTFMEVEAQFFWTAIPDWRIAEFRVAGDGDEVFTFICYAGSTADGVELEPIWTADRFFFDEAGRVKRWLQVTDLGAWAAWQALNTTNDYVTHVATAYAAAGIAPRFTP